MLSFAKVSTYYGKIQALHDVSVEVKKRPMRRCCCARSK